MMQTLTLDDLWLIPMVKCAMCRSLVSLTTIESQINEGLTWKRHGMTGSVVCGYCWKDMGE